MPKTPNPIPTNIDLFSPNHLGTSIAGRIDASGDCWEWTGPTDKRGYARVCYKGTLFYVHRLMWTVLVGAIPEDRYIDHLCRNTSCVNPDHLEVVTHAENVRRGMTGKVNHRNSRKTHCPQGHPYSGKNLWVSKDGHRQCRRCHRERERRYKVNDSASRGEIP